MEEEDHVRKGIELAEEGDIRAAKSEFDIAEHQDPKKADLYYKMGMPGKRPMVKRALSGKLLVLWVAVAIALSGAYMLDDGGEKAPIPSAGISPDASGDASTDGADPIRRPKGGGGDIQVRDASGGAAYQADRGVIEGFTGLNLGLPVYVGVIVFLIVTFFILQDAYKLYLSGEKKK